MQSLMTRRVAATEQGRLQGAISSIMGITGMIGPPLFTGIFAHFIGEGAGLHLPGAPFLLATALIGIAVVIAERATRSARRSVEGGVAPEAAQAAS
jgi:DHA1 family tetracycline resistance protein-like MFS transporter